jgi:hypothetical protein
VAPSDRSPTRAILAWGLVLGILGCSPALYSRLDNSQTSNIQRASKADGSVARDWQANPAILQVTAAGDILAIGDVHGDYDRLVALLLSTRMIARDPKKPADVEWTAGTATLVFTGDLIDKGPKCLDVLTVVQALRDSAAVKGGRVIITMGNHEAEFLADPTVDKVADFRGELQNAGISVKDVASGRHPLGAFLRSLPFGVRVNNWFFCHAGNTDGRTLPQLDAALRAGVDADGFSSAMLLDPNSMLEARLSPAPWWENGKTPSLAVLSRNTAALGVQHIVMGHQPGDVVFADGSSRKKGEIYQKGGLIFLIDGGMSQGVDHSRGAVLRMAGPNHAQATVLYPNGTMKALWP